MKIALLDVQTLSDNDVSLEIFNKFGKVYKSVTLSGKKLINFLKDKDAVLANRSVLNKDVIESCPNLKYIGLFATGYNNVDLNAADKRNITVCNVPEYSTNTVAEQTLCFMLMLCKNTEKYRRFVKKGKWSFKKEFGYFPFALSELNGKTVGIYGLGNIGKRVAEICSVLKMNVIYFSKSGKKDVPYKYVSKEELFKNSDFLTLHCPLTDETKDIINEETLSLMKKSAFLINTARGGLVNNKDLANALKNKKIAGAALDVVKTEPIEKNDPLLKLKTDNIIFTPHIAWACLETRKELIKLSAKNLEKFLSGNPINVVNRK